MKAPRTRSRATRKQTPIPRTLRGAVEREGLFKPSPTDGTERHRVQYVTAIEKRLRGLLDNGERPGDIAKMVRHPRRGYFTVPTLFSLAHEHGVAEVRSILDMDEDAARRTRLAELRDAA